jgi:hypothetical protein
MTNTRYIFCLHKTFINYFSNKIVPLYPFGFGLSYTSFVWSNPSISFDSSVVNISITVSNVGDFPGSDVVQIYVQYVFCFFLCFVSKFSFLKMYFFLKSQSNTKISQSNN